DEIQPRNSTIRPIRAGLQAERGLWDEAVIDLREAMQRGNRSAQLLPQYALALLQSGDKPGWQRFCEQLVAGLKDADSPEVVAMVLQSCLLAPDALKDMKKLAPLAEKVAQATRNPYHARLIKGATLHRLGELEKAIEELKEADKLVGREAMNLPEHL